MPWGHRRRKGAQEGSQSGQFDRQPKGKRGRPKKVQAVTVDGRCGYCGGVEGRHNQVRVSRRQPNGTYKIVFERCRG